MTPTSIWMEVYNRVCNRIVEGVRKRVNVVVVNKEVRKALVRRGHGRWSIREEDINSIEVDKREGRVVENVNGEQGVVQKVNGECRKDSTEIDKREGRVVENVGKENVECRFALPLLRSIEEVLELIPIRDIIFPVRDTIQEYTQSED